MWNLGLLGAAGGTLEAGSYDLLDTQILPGSSATITFNNLGTYAAGYQHLQIRYTGRSTRSATNSEFYFRFNGDTGSNYSHYYMRGDGSGTESAQITTTSNSNGFRVYQSLTAATFNANTFAPGIIDINDAFDSTKFKSVKIRTGFAGSALDRVLFEGGVWLNTNSITSFTLEEFYGASFVANTRVSLYGLGKKV